ncbi:hypothetical protein BCR36DRAFT_222943, partial [Piromyces finnis]
NVARFLRLTFLQSKDRFRSNILNLKYFNSVGSSSFQIMEYTSDASLECGKEVPATNIEKISFEPSLYYKIINKITQGTIGACIVTIPTVLFIIYCIFLTFIKWDILKNGLCSVDATYMNKIFYYGFMLYVVALPFVGYQTFKYSHTIRKFDYISYVICLLIGFGTLFLESFVVITNNYLYEVLGLSSIFMFAGAQFGAIVIPLIEVHIEKKKKKDNLLSLNKYEFQKLIMDYNYFDMLREFAIQLFCVEVVLFWEMNFELLYKLNRYLLSKKKIILEKDIKKGKSMKTSGRQESSTNVLKTSLDGEYSRKNSQTDDARSDYSFKFKRNVSNIIKSCDVDINRKNSQDADAILLSLNHNEFNNKYQNFENLKETHHLGKRAQLLKKYLLDLNNVSAIYISSECLSFHNDDFPIEFNKEFKATYDKLYQLFMDINAPALLNIKENTINDIKERLSKGDYSFDMYMD